MDAEVARALRALPSIDAIVASDQIASLAEFISPAIVVSIARTEQERSRAAILNGNVRAGESLLSSIVHELQRLNAPPFPAVINGTGVILQTNLGRAPVCQSAAEAINRAATNYVGLETDLESGARGGRGRDIQALFRALTGAEQTLIVNNNASAVLLALASTASGREVIVSRGEAVEIGGGFRIPDVLRQSGAILVEVGTTNRTYTRDYADAITDRTAAILRVHASNFSISGFTARPELPELANLARSKNVLMIEDVGSGCLLDTTEYGLEHEPTLSESIAAGVDLVCASGDKLLGGPQAGIVLGRAESMELLRRHPLARALRADKTCLAGLAATLQHYVRGEATEHVPVWWMISRHVDWIQTRVRQWSAAFPGTDATVVTSDSIVGGGSLPGKTLPSFALSIARENQDAETLARSLRAGSPIVFPRIEGGRVLIDARTVLEGQDDDLLVALRAVLTW